MKPGLGDYLRSAFNARPIGMWVPPNWVGLAAFGLLGVVNPGFWLLGAGLELGYLYSLVTSRRFRRVVEGRSLAAQRDTWVTRQNELVHQLDPEDDGQYRALEERCQTILAQQRGGSADSDLQLRQQAEGLGRLMWIFLRLLLTRRSLRLLLREAEEGNSRRESLDERIARLQEKLKDESVTEDLRKSFAGQIDILQQRLQKQAEARQKMAFLEAELMRIREQVELIREQAFVAADPEIVSQRIDQIAATLGGTTQWIRDQQQLFGKVEDLLVDPPPVVLPQQEPLSQ